MLTCTLAIKSFAELFQKRPYSSYPSYSSKEGMLLTEKKTSRSEQTRLKILAAAEAVFAEKGLDGARVDEIAALAGANKRMLYEYYESKENLYGVVLQSVYQRLGDCELFLTAAPETPDAEQAIGDLVAAYFSFLEKNPTYVRMVMWENLYGARHFDAMGLGGVRDPVKKAIRQLVAAGRKTGVFRAEADEEQVLMTLFACTFNFFSNIHTMSRVMGRDLAAGEALVQRQRQVTELLLCYLTPKGD